MKIENKLLIVAVTVLIIVFVALQFARVYGEELTAKIAWTSCVAGCTEECTFYVGEDVEGKTKEESEEYLKNEMRLYQITNEEVLQEVERCKAKRNNNSNPNPNPNPRDNRPFYPYSELLKEE